MQSVPILEPQGLPHIVPWGCWQWGAARAPSNLHARGPAQAQRLHQLLTEAALQCPPH